MRVRTGLMLAVVFGGLLVMSYALGPRGQSKAPATIPWESNVTAALAKAEAQHKLVMVDFYTTWCRWCQRLDATTLSEPAVAAKISDGFVPVRLDAENDGRELAQKFGVDSYPTVVFLDKSGQEVYRIAGYLEPQDFLRELENVKAGS